jgi:hypothetical protein
MSDATHGAEEIRNDINALSQRYAVVKRDETCKVSKCCAAVFGILNSLRIFLLIMSVLRSPQSDATLPSLLILPLGV